MSNKHLYVIEVEKLLEDYRVVVDELTAMSKELSEFDPSKLDIEKDKEFISKQRKNFFLGNLYDQSLLSIISKLEILSKLIQLDNVEVSKDTMEILQKVVGTVEHLFVIENGKIKIINEVVNQILEGDTLDLSTEELKSLMNGEKD